MSTAHRRFDVLLAVVLTAWSVLGETGLSHPWSAAAVVLWVAPVALRTTAPMAMALLSAAGVLAYGLAPGATNATPFLGTLVLGFCLGMSLSGRRLAVAVAVFAAASGTTDALVVHHQAVAVRVTALVTIVGGPVVLGVVLRRARAQTLELQRLHAELAVEREARARDAAAAERNRIARDLHDVISHSVSAMVVQANAAESQLPVGEPAREQLLAVRRTGKETLTELRRLLGVLREAT